MKSYGWSIKTCYDLFLGGNPWVLTREAAEREVAVMNDPTSLGYGALANRTPFRVVELFYAEPGEEQRIAELERKAALYDELATYGAEPAVMTVSHDVLRQWVAEGWRRMVAERYWSRPPEPAPVVEPEQPAPASGRWRCHGCGAEAQEGALGWDRMEPHRNHLRRIDEGRVGVCGPCTPIDQPEPDPPCDRVAEACDAALGVSHG